MLVFIDDSGDPGFKLGKGSSDFFIISAVIFDDYLEAEKTALAIKELRRELFKRDDVEFKFHKSKKEVRVKFLECIKKFKFRIRYLVVEKNVLYSPTLRSDRNSFYSYTIKTMLKYSNNTILNAKIRVDGGGDRIFRKSFISYLRKELNGNEKKILQNCKLIDSKSDVLIQLADMIAGSIHRSYQRDKDDSKIYKKIFKKQIEDEWNFR
jgi:sugar-specific transcriptional regulator TrmB